MSSGSGCGVSGNVNILIFYKICRYDMAVHINSKILMREVASYYQYVYTTLEILT